MLQNIFKVKSLFGLCLENKISKQNIFHSLNFKLFQKLMRLCNCQYYFLPFYNFPKYDKLFPQLHFFYYLFQVTKEVQNLRPSYQISSKSSRGIFLYFLFFTLFMNLTVYMYQIQFYFLPIISKKIKEYKTVHYLKENQNSRVCV